MSQRFDSGEGEYVIHADGVRAVQVHGRMQIRIAEPTSTEQVLSVAGALWEVWTNVRDRVVFRGLPCELFVQRLEETPIPLANVFSLIDQDLAGTGRQLQVYDCGGAFAPEVELMT